MNDQHKEPIMTNDTPTPDLSSLPLVMADFGDEEWAGPMRLIRTKYSPYLGKAVYYVIEEITDDAGDSEMGTAVRIKPYTQPTVRPMTHAEVFAAIRAGAVVRWKYSRACVFTGWTTEARISNYEICYHYTGTDSDVWSPMTTEEK